jgi:CheY-like chemotaxis protein
VLPDPLVTSPLVALAELPVRALAFSGWGSETAGGEVGLTALAGVAAALAWHHLSRRRGAIAHRWQQMHAGDRLPILRLGKRLQRFHVRDAIAAVLHRRADVPAGTGPAQAAAHAPRRVLIVDDDPDVRSALGEILASEGCAVTEAGDGWEGLRVAREERPDLILLDLMMPRMDGFQFRTAQRGDAAIASIPVVVISGSDADAGQGFGAAAYLHKPFDLGALVATVDRCAVPA